MAELYTGKVRHLNYTTTKSGSRFRYSQRSEGLRAGHVRLGHRWHKGDCEDFHATLSRSLEPRRTTSKRTHSHDADDNFSGVEDILAFDIHDEETITLLAQLHGNKGKALKWLGYLPKRLNECMQKYFHDEDGREESNARQSIELSKVSSSLCSLLIPCFASTSNQLCATGEVLFEACFHRA